MNFKTHVSFYGHTIDILNLLYDDITIAVSRKNAIVNKSRSFSKDVKDDVVPISSNENATTSPSEVDKEPLLSNPKFLPNKEEPNTHDENETLDEFMRKYTEARHYARTREVRGGILL